MSRLDAEQIVSLWKAGQPEKAADLARYAAEGQYSRDLYEVLSPEGLRERTVQAAERQVEEMGRELEALDQRYRESTSTAERIEVIETVAEFLPQRGQTRDAQALYDMRVRWGVLRALAGYVESTSINNLAEATVAIRQLLDGMSSYPNLFYNSRDQFAPVVRKLKEVEATLGVLEGSKRQKAEEFVEVATQYVDQGERHLRDTHKMVDPEMAEYVDKLREGN